MSSSPPPIPVPVPMPVRTASLTVRVPPPLVSSVTPLQAPPAPVPVRGAPSLLPVPVPSLPATPAATAHQTSASSFAHPLGSHRAPPPPALTVAVSAPVQTQALTTPISPSSPVMPVVVKSTLSTLHSRVAPHSSASPSINAPLSLHTSTLRSPGSAMVPQVRAPDARVSFASSVGTASPLMPVPVPVPLVSRALTASPPVPHSIVEPPRIAAPASPVPFYPAVEVRHDTPLTPTPVPPPAVPVVRLTTAVSTPVPPLHEPPAEPTSVRGNSPLEAPSGDEQPHPAAGPAAQSPLEPKPAGHIDYSSHLSPQIPPASASSLTVHELGFTASLPAVLPGGPTVSLDAAAAASAMPAPLPPAAITFGGASYRDAAFLEYPRPSAKAGGEGFPSYSEAAAEWKRLQFMVDQLTVARSYLKLRTARGGLAGEREPPRGCPRAAIDSSIAAESSSDEAVDFTKTNLCTAAYCGTAQQLHTLIANAKRCDTVGALGYVTLRHRHWGIKKSREEYLLGLGMKGTPLQFAALARRLDNVVILLASGAQDREEPTLKSLLPAAMYKLVTSATKATRTVKKTCAPPPVGDDKPPGVSTEQFLQQVASVEFGSSVDGQGPSVAPQPAAQRQFTSVSVQQASFLS